MERPRKDTGRPAPDPARTTERPRADPPPPDDLGALGWFDHPDEEPLVIEGRGDLGIYAAGAGVFLLGLVLWSWAFAPETPRWMIEAMVGLERGPEHLEDHDDHDDQLWAASFSEEANYSGDAVPLRAPQPGDWLYHFPEPGQTLAQFKAHAQNHRTAERTTIYLMPLGALDARMQPILSATAEFIDAYYATPTRILDPETLPARALNARRGQYDARVVLNHLAAHMPDDALGVLGVTDEDLFIPSVNYVFGLGSFRQRVSVFSVHRYGDDYRLDGQPGTVLRRSMTVAVHELGHVLSMRHCTAYRCIMNGTHSLAEADQHPMHLCPVCRRKAEHVLHWHRQDRYANLRAFYEKYSMEPELAFVERRLEPPVVEFIPDPPLPERLPAFLRD